MLKQALGQLKPHVILESPTDKVQQFLVEAQSASTSFEGVIAACHNIPNNNETNFKKAIMKDPYVRAFLKAADKATGKSAFATTKKSDIEKQDILWNFSKVCANRLPKGTSDAGAGQSKKQVSPMWKELTKKGKDTSKADIMISGLQTSVKGPAAQLMSGEQKETRATVITAMKISGEKQLTLGLMTEVDKFITNTRTVGADINGRILKKMSTEDAITTGNEEAKKIIDSQERLKAGITQKFKEAFANPAVGDAFALEAMTGYEKFAGKAFGGSGNPSGEATHMVIWDYRMDRLKFVAISGSFVSQTAKKMAVKPDLKSNSYSSDGIKKGYSFYQALRVSVEVILDKYGELSKEVQEEVKYSEKMLSEGTLSEINFKKIIGKAWEFFKSKVANLWNWFAKRIAAIRDHVVKLITGNVDNALAVFELDVDVKVNTEVKL